MKLLVISLAGIGDTLLATPLIHELRANFPDAQIDALVRWKGSLDLLEGNPWLNRIYHRDFAETGKAGSLKFLRELRKSRYHVSINTHPQSRIQYRLIAWLAGARLRLSHRYECSGMLDRLLVNRTLPQDYQRHTVENNLALLSFLQVKPVLRDHRLEVFLSSAEEARGESFVLENRLTNRMLLGVHVGSGATKNLALKRWPLDQYIVLLQRLKHSHPQLTSLLFGGPEEEQALLHIVEQVGSPFAVRAKTKTMRDVAALMRQCAAFLSVDTALMHLAAAMRVPRQVVIEAPTLNRTNEPYGNAYSVVKNPAVGGKNLDYYRYDGRNIQGGKEELLRCMASVTVEMVYDAIVKALSTDPSL